VDGRNLDQKALPGLRALVIVGVRSLGEWVHRTPGG